mmetsp:Transcript_11325/g.14475  ORF Transcript_11325/g.14475 Transcript_11325/m.14475 type:complete len:97 (+) Transcript_11325:167-457(+)
MSGSGRAWKRLLHSRRIRTLGNNIERGKERWRDWEGMEWGCKEREIELRGGVYENVLGREMKAFEELASARRRRYMLSVLMNVTTNKLLQSGGDAK